MDPWFHSCCYWGCCNGWWISWGFGGWAGDASTVTNRVISGARYFSDSGDQRWKHAHWTDRLCLKTVAQPGKKQVAVANGWKASAHPCGNGCSFPAPEDAQERGPSSQAGTRMTRGPAMCCELSSGWVRALSVCLAFQTWGGSVSDSHTQHHPRHDPTTYRLVTLDELLTLFKL